MSLNNRQIAELFAGKSAQAEGHRKKAYERAGREAMAWPVEAADMASSGGDLTTLVGIGPSLARTLNEWLQDAPEIPEPPASRQGFMTMAEALATIESDPSWTAKLRADLQMHTNYSDGTSSVAQMAEAAAERGYEYIAITDHSAGQRIPPGMNSDQIAQQAREIEAVNASGGIRVLRGIEMNLTPTGEGDTDPEVLDNLDIVLGSFHSKLRITEDQTARYLAGLLNPNIQVLAHPKGRRWDVRVGLHADWPTVFEAAATLDKAVEIDANPNRQDLPVDLLTLAVEAGVRISMGTDAHDPDEFRFMPYALASALKAGVQRDRILNLMPVEDLLEWVASVRGLQR